MLESIPVEILGEIIAFTSTMEKMKLLKISKEVRTYLLSTTLFVVGTTNSNSSRMNYRPDFAHFFLLSKHLDSSPKKGSEDNWRKFWFSSTTLSSTDRHEFFFGSSLLRQLQLYRVSPFAGTGKKGDSGDEGLAIHATLNSPWDVCVRPDGSVVIADNSCRLRVVDTNGIIHNFAGTGEHDYGGDGGPAIHAKLWSVAAVCLDPQGRIVFADLFNHCIRRIELDGTIHTIAGIPRKSGRSGDDGMAKEFNLYDPYGVHVCDDGKILIADTDNRRVCMLDESGKIRTLVGPEATLLSDGTAVVKASIGSSVSVSQGKDGTIFIADSKRISTLFNGKLENFVHFISVSYRSSPHTFVNVGNDGTIYATDAGRVYVIDEQRKPQPFATGTTIKIPSGHVSGERGRLFIADSGDDRVYLMEGWFEVQ